MSAIDIRAASAQLPARTWVLLARDAGALRRFRTASGIVLAVYWVRNAIQSTPVLAYTGLFDAHMVAGRARQSPLGDGLLPVELWCLFGLAALASLCGALSYVPRLCSVVVLVMSILTYWALLPVAYVDDTAACVISLFGLLLPSQSDRRAVPGVAITTGLAMLIVLYALGLPGNLSGAARTVAPVVAIVSRMIAVCLVMPAPAFAKLGVTAQVALHMYLAGTTPAPILNMSLAATALLFWGDVSPHSTRSLDVGGAIAPAGALLVALASAGTALGCPGIATRAQQILLDFGLVPANPTPLPQAATVLEFEYMNDTGARDVYRYTTSPVRTQLLLALLARSTTTPLGFAVLERLALRYCQAHSEASYMSRLRLVGDPRILTDFACDGHGRVSRGSL
jgi:hypothetical protein